MTCPRRLPWLLVAALLGTLVLGGCADDEAAPPAPVERVLVYTMPGVTWDDIAANDLPNLERLLDDAAIGDVSTRIGRDTAGTTAAYLTIGAGTRAVVPGVDAGVALNPDELHAGVPASELLRRRLGRAATGIAYIPVGATIEANADSAFGARPGMLGDALDQAGVHRVVVANSDAAEGFPTDQPVPDGAFARSAVAALMGSDGLVPAGTVGRGLLETDPDAAFGRRLDHDLVLQAFDEEWEKEQRTVALVEASDLSRAAAYAPRSSPSQARALRRQALEQSDALLGQLLERIDPKTDAVLVVAPTTRSGLGMVALSAPSAHGGLLRSASTRRDGYVYLADVAPTILELLGEEQPGDIEGRAFDVAPAQGDRITKLTNEADDAAVRDARLPKVVTAVIAILAVLTLAVVERDLLGPRVRALLRPAAFAVLGVVPGTFLAGLVPATHTSDLLYAAMVLGVAAVVAAICIVADRRREGLGVMVGVGSVLLVIGLDVVAGAPLQVNAVFGYSMAVAGRFTGVGNLAFALFASAAVCLAVVGWETYGRRAVPWIVAMLTAVVLVDGLPMLGADVGGVSAVVPAFLLTGLVLVGRRVGWKQVLLGVGLGVVVVGVFGVLDSIRPAGSQTHLARVGEHLTSGRFDSVATILWRRVHASFGTSDSLVVVLAFAVVAIALAQAMTVAKGRPWPSWPRQELSPGALALAVGLGTLAVLGLASNDSSIAVPATMLIVIVPVLLLRATAGEEPT